MKECAYEKISAVKDIDGQIKKRERMRQRKYLKTVVLMKRKRRKERSVKTREECGGDISTRV